MLTIKKHPKTSLMLLGLVVIAMIFLFLTYHTYGNWEFALKLRGKKLLAFVIVGLLTSFSTISFQTISQNHFLTPSILGFDSLYVLIQTVLFFILGQSRQGDPKLFIFNIVIMVILSVLLFSTLLKKEKQDLFLLLMIGMILGTLFRSISTFLQVLMDPNEYDKLQGKLFASFSNVDVSLLTLVIPVVIILMILFFKVSAKLDVLHLGIEQATNLGIDVQKFRKYVLFLISLSVAIATALIGPITFLGFIVANVTYQWMNTYKHTYLFISGALLSILFLVAGQFLVEQVFHMNTTLSVVIEFSGGLYFVWKLLKEKGGVN
ncbi:iron chelate uptake ABC transporter family permease subunit [Vagococcus fluvialis]|jgi:iron complex transport system permease protein|uniref:iron chelate uptake ABC transporter family permease subunit n=1 Tax=Vagococcus fluvialis TaxID=2738 RepID=UPI001A8FDAFE|nr:iron chelate uptake ABC transporter family permease subunit [Vagococcus fluvialis]MBO0429434.1 iron chelate uptake ABC transporter family permease subunit [Vagococcus fluvialis]UDM71005.1 iron chelate uptake ABC transporter family permease subunit [Vagococcus fluvialis]UDM75863.1 iron chelate uptake ABC transporter family permease subunit [Vagococcus fluvialis]UDM82693.1 iron chelate uptake ABC transporter family permease subunit [Vagococcus fluvialis]